MLPLEWRKNQLRVDLCEYVRESDRSGSHTSETK